jgi:hypothetical protein
VGKWVVCGVTWDVYCRWRSWGCISTVSEVYIGFSRGEGNYGARIDCCLRTSKYAIFRILNQCIGPERE